MGKSNYQTRRDIEEMHASTEKWEPDSFRDKAESDPINPAHYKDSYPFEAIDLIEKALTPEQFQGYLLGNELKYRLRAGVKTADFEQDMLKAKWYRQRRTS